MTQITLIGIALACAAGYYSRQDGRARTVFTVMCILLAVGALMTLPILSGVRVIASMLIAYALTVFFFKQEAPSSVKILRRDNKAQSPQSVNVVFADTTPLADLLPTPHMAIAAKSGAGLTTFIAMVAKAAHADGRPVMVIGRDENEENRVYGDIPKDEDFVSIFMSRLFGHTQDVQQEMNDIWVRAEAFSHKPGAIILFDTVHTSNNAEKISGLIKNGARVISSSQCIPDIITSQTTLMAFASIMYPHEEGLFTSFNVSSFAPGEAVMLTPGQIAKEIKIELPTETA